VCSSDLEALKVEPEGHDGDKQRFEALGTLEVPRVDLCPWTTCAT
jgi:hypothetical protein